jgi:molybdenum cofactor guanylyltransferase
MAEHRTKMKGTGRMTLSAVLLAGGESRRMGRDKATIEFEGRPLWERQLEVLRALGPASIFVSARTRPSWLSDKVELLLDDPPSRGPLSGLTKAVAAMRTTHLIALAIDMPFMTSEQLGVLCSLSGESCGVVPRIAERAEPLAAIYPAEAAGDFAAAFAGPDYSLQRVVRKLAVDQKVRCYLVPAEDEHFYRSVNEPGDIAP